MLSIEIPGKGEIEFKHLVLDFNGTIALDGVIKHGVREQLHVLGEQINIHVVTADTNGSVYRECEGLPVEVHVIGKEDQLYEKKRFLEQFHKQGTIAIGNGVNDELMFASADLAIAVMGTEGCATSSLLKSDIVVKNINDGLDLFLKSNRLIATLRK